MPQQLLVVVLCIFLAFSDACASTGSGKGKGGKGGKGSRYGSGREEDMGWNRDPDEDNVESPPAVPFTDAPSGTPTRLSVSPSASPTDMPSPSPSASPTVSRLPTVSPSSLPTITAAPSQSPAPTISAAPTQSHAPTITASPSQSFAPTITPAPSQSSAPTFSSAPSVSASPTGTASPSQSPAPTVSLSPTVELCETNADGFFGDATSDGIVVSYTYELEYEAGTNERDVVSDLESSFNNFLLPFLFPSECPTVTRRVLVSQRRLETVGVSKRPDDVPLVGGK